MRALLLASAIAAAHQQAPSFVSEVGTVYVDVFVSRDGEPVTGLTPDDFEVRDEGVIQRARVVALDQVPVSAVLAFDLSSSVSGEELEKLRDAGHAVAGALRDTAGMALVGFDHEVRLLTPATTSPAALRSALDRIESGGATSLWDALFVAAALPMPAQRRIVVLFTDGDDTASWLTAGDARNAAVRAGILLHAVTLRTTERETRSGFRGGLWTERVAAPRAVVLSDIAEATGGRLWEARDADRLEETFVQLANELSFRYVLAYEPEGVDAAGEHEIDVRLRGVRGKIRARKGYVARP